MERDTDVGIDSQCLSYLIDAFEGIEEPKDPLAEERIALARVFFYSHFAQCVTPTVVAECMEIVSDERRETHQSWIRTQFSECRIVNPLRVDERTKEFFAFHRKHNDCQILAEAEDSGLSVLLTYDSRFLSKLSSKSTLVRLSRPSQFWAGLEIPRGTEPKWTPYHGNPLGKQQWWLW